MDVKVNNNGLGRIVGDPGDMDTFVEHVNNFFN